jgi:hypothetical protein
VASRLRSAALFVASSLAFLALAASVCLNFLLACSIDKIVFSSCNLLSSSLSF